MLITTAGYCLPIFAYFFGLFVLLFVTSVYGKNAYMLLYYTNYTVAPTSSAVKIFAYLKKP